MVTIMKKFDYFGPRARRSVKTCVSPPSDEGNIVPHSETDALLKVLGDVGSTVVFTAKGAKKFESAQKLMTKKMNKISNHTAIAEKVVKDDNVKMKTKRSHLKVHRKHQVMENRVQEKDVSSTISEPPCQKKMPAKCTKDVFEPSAKARSQSKKKTKQRKRLTRGQQLSREADDKGVPHNLERGKRKRIPTLRHWLCERPVYDEKGNCIAISEAFDDSKDINIYSQRKPAKVVINELESDVSIVHDEKQHEVLQRVWFLKKDLEYFGPLMEPAKPTDAYFYSNFCPVEGRSCGYLFIRPLKQKGTEQSGAYRILYNVVSGMVEVVVHESRCVLKSGDCFNVPPFNCYKIKNLRGRSNSTLHFDCQQIS